MFRAFFVERVVRHVNEKLVTQFTYTYSYWIACWIFDQNPPTWRTFLHFLDCSLSDLWMPHTSANTIYFARTFNFSPAGCVSPTSPFVWSIRNINTILWRGHFALFRGGIGSVRPTKSCELCYTTVNTSVDTIYFAVWSAWNQDWICSWDTFCLCLHLRVYPNKNVGQPEYTFVLGTQSLRLGTKT